MGNLNSDKALVPDLGDDIEDPIAGVLGAVVAPDDPLVKVFRLGG